MIKTTLTTLMFVAFLSVTLRGVTPTQAQSAAKPNPKAMVAAGQEVFNKNCLACHSIIEGQVGVGPNLKGETKKATGKKTPAEIKVILKNGKNGKMPAWEGKLSDKEMDEVIAYLKTV